MIVSLAKANDITACESNNKEEILDKVKRCGSFDKKNIYIIIPSLTRTIKRFVLKRKKPKLISKLGFTKIGHTYYSIERFEKEIKEYLLNADIEEGIEVLRSIDRFGKKII